jgi:hypothetical protein
VRVSKPVADVSACVEVTVDSFSIRERSASGDPESSSRRDPASVTVLTQRKIRVATDVGTTVGP